MTRAPLHQTIASLFIASAMLVTAAPTKSLAETDKPSRLSFVYVQSRSTPKTQWLIKIYTEALKRMGIEFKFVDVPARRASLYSDSGRVDGELNRISTYGNVYTNMIRVPEKNLDGSFTAFSLNPAIHLDGWDGLRGTAYKVGLLRGVVFCEENLSLVLPEDQLFPVADIAQGVKMLADRRIDILVFNTAAMRLFLETKKGQTILHAFADLRALHESGIMGTTQGHAWLHKSHADLVEPLAKTLREMKAEGLFELYSKQTGFYPNQETPH